METLQFKTNIKCSGCVAKSTPFLNEAVGEENWSVDTDNPNKVLTIKSSESIDPREIIQAVATAGFKAERMSS